MEPFRVFTTVKYARELALKSQNHTKFSGSRADKVLREVYGGWYIHFINPEECLLT
jgi:hypothetical protein